MEPVLLLKLEFLQYQYNYVRIAKWLKQAAVQHGPAFRWFLDLSLHSALPHHTSLTYFRERLGFRAGINRFIDAVIGQAREKRLVKDRHALSRTPPM